MSVEKLCTCKICGGEYMGHPTSRYCVECRVIADKENMRRHRVREKEKREEAKAQARAEALAVLGTPGKPKPAPKPEPVEKDPEWLVNPDRKQCKGCKYSAPFHSQSSGERFCDYMKKHAEEVQELAKEQGLPWDGRMERRKHDGPVCLVRCCEK